MEDGVALFPDVPTGRGSRHLRTLIDLHRQGDRAAVVFIIQRADAHGFAPHQNADPVFTATLQTAVESGVEVGAYTCHVSLTEITIANRVPVILHPTS